MFKVYTSLQEAPVWVLYMVLRYNYTHALPEKGRINSYMSVLYKGTHSFGVNYMGATVSV